MSLQHADYLTDRRRLRDVLTLIQLLGFGEKPALTTNEICRAIQDLDGGPNPTLERMLYWETVARAHPEFFRVWGGAESKMVALGARYVASDKSAGRILKASFVQHLMTTALEIHDRDARRHEKWALYLPLVIAIIGAAGAILTALIGLLGNKP